MRKMRKYMYKDKNYQNKTVKGFENKTLKLNAPLRGLLEGALVPVQVDGDGIILDRYWRDRVKDSSIDNCVEIVEVKKRKESDK